MERAIRAAMLGILREHFSYQDQVRLVEHAAMLAERRPSMSRRALALAVTIQISRYCNSSFHMWAGQIWLSRSLYQCI